MQFAGRRTDLDLNPIGEAVNIYVKLNTDTLPAPQAIAVNRITPQMTQEGLSENEFCKYVLEGIFTPNTISVGFNSVRFDNEMLRFTFWRNFQDAYEWEWKDGRSRWDLLDVVRMTRALRPEGIEWPFNEDGRPNNKLENLTRVNKISHEDAHDAMCDVEASIALAKLLKTKQPELFNWLFSIRSKNAVAAKVNLENAKAFVYSNGRYDAEFLNTSVAIPVAVGKNKNEILVYDLRYDITEKMAQLEASEQSSADDENVHFRSPIKTLKLNRCPAIAPLGVLEEGGAWERIKLSQTVVEQHLRVLQEHKADLQKLIEAYNQRDFAQDDKVAAEEKLYDSFLSDYDKNLCKVVQKADAYQLAAFHPEFHDERLNDLYIGYKGRNFPDSLNEEEYKKYEKYRQKRLEGQAEEFKRGLESIAKDEKNAFIVKELELWAQNVAQ